MANQRSRDQRVPPHVLAATSYVLLPGARNVSGKNTKRAGRWPSIVEYDGDPDGIAKLKHEDGESHPKHLAMLERRGQLRFNTSPSTIIEEDEESRNPEGAPSYRLHRRLERDTPLARKAKENRLRQTGRLCCDVCCFDFLACNGDIGDGFIEAHHTIPVSKLKGIVKTKLSDLALVCSNCHRMLHRGPKLLTIEELRDRMKK